MPVLRPWLSYAQRRWRTTGLLVVLLYGTLVYGAVADRGHDPAWTDEGAEIESLAASPDGAFVFALRRGAAEARALEAWTRDGALAWNMTVEGEEAHVAVGDAWVAVVSVGDEARLRVAQTHDGLVLLDEPVRGVPRGVAADGRTIAVALRAPEDAVLVWERLELDRTLHMGATVTALDVSGRAVAAGTSDGRVLVDRAGRTLGDFETDFSVRSVRLDGDGSRLVVGGFSPGGEQAGGLAVYDLNRAAAGPRWRVVTEGGVSVVDVSADGEVVLALEEAPHRGVLRFAPGDGGEAWRWTAPGVVWRLGTTGGAGAHLAPDGRSAVVGTLAGGVDWIDVEARAVAWSWRAKGVTAVAFGDDDPRAVAAAVRLYPSHGHDRLAFFLADAEPFPRDMARVLPALLVAELVLGALVLGVGRLRELRA